VAYWLHQWQYLAEKSANVAPSVWPGAFGYRLSCRRRMCSVSLAAGISLSLAFNGGYSQWQHSM